jgi:transcriptional regulator with XRE-family HTH domain
MRTPEELTFGAHLRAVRLEKGLTQEALGVLTGLHRNYISSVERGERNVGLINILKLAKALSVHPSRVLDCF